MDRSVRLGSLRSPSRTAVEMVGGDARSYSVLDGRCNRLANALLGLGLKRGDRVGAWLTTSIECLELFIAIGRAGLVIVPINERFKADEAAFQLQNSGARALFFSDTFASEVDRLGVLSDLVVAVSVGRLELDGVVDFEKTLAGGRNDMPSPPSEDDPAIIAYTSGTTGFPKGATLSHRAVHNVARVMAHACRYPMYGIHAFAGSMSFVGTVLAQLLPHLYVGGTILLLGRWDPEFLLTTIHSRGATFTYVPTPGLRDFALQVLAEPEKCRTLVAALHGGSTASPELIQLMLTAIGPRFIEGWGMTENSGCLLTATSIADFTSAAPAESILESVGRAVVGVALEVVDDDGHQLPHDGSTVGLLVAQSSTMMMGYWKNPDATRAAFVDSWYRTGDLGSIDPDGYVRIVARRTDLILSGGMNIYPSEIERVLASCVGVREVIVVGTSHPKWDQTPVAFVVCDPSAALTEKAIIDHCRAHLANYKTPSQVIFVDSLPRNASDKVIRAKLRQMISSKTQ